MDLIRGAPPSGPSVSTRVPDKLPQAMPCDDGWISMLPGFRFLFAAIVLSVSTLVFGLGAAALLRASHETFASLPAAPPAPALPSVATADASPHDAAPTLALLRVDAPEIDAAPVPRAVPAPMSDHATPAPVAEDIVAAPPPPDLSVSEPTSVPAEAETASEPSGTTDMATDKVETGATASSIPEAPEAAPEAAVAQPETRPEAVAIPTDTATAEPAQAQPVPAQPAQAETAQQAAPSRPEPAKPETAKAEPAMPRIPDVALTNEPRPAPLAPDDAPIKTAMLAPTDPTPSASPEAAVAIAGPIPLPRSREWALAQGHAAQRAARPRKLAAIRARPHRVVRQPVRPQVQAPASAPNLLFPFGQ